MRWTAFLTMSQADSPNSSKHAAREQRKICSKMFSGHTVDAIPFAAYRLGHVDQVTLAFPRAEQTVPLRQRHGELRAQ